MTCDTRGREDGDETNLFLEAGEQGRRARKSGCMLGMACISHAEKMKEKEEEEIIKPDATTDEVGRTSHGDDMF